MPRLAAFCLPLVLSACASAQEQVLDKLVGDRVQGDASQVLVSGADGPADALPLAIAHCTRFGRAAQFRSREADKLAFACVPK